ncbi:hypothetical protein ELI44_30075 (plasmid) [Rhizobium ruizarguesonis]|uniref:hypothetical protein n=1 Tax=Rhizobium ruizarguesonis TaxID=2081791 RepID=UPI00103077F0|nr:hypothetical protein [Rhizobium ruizarguesonis]TAU38384.1 hypothetical protein ELI42_30055 [Rhizobium ruizarguesonis]TAU56016.1 hypothetical protein ELI44_30075 [Rhizobium ruizarguesonis]
MGILKRYRSNYLSATRYIWLPYFGDQRKDAIVAALLSVTYLTLIPIFSRKIIAIPYDRWGGLACVGLCMVLLLQILLFSRKRYAKTLNWLWCSFLALVAISVACTLCLLIGGSDPPPTPPAVILQPALQAIGEGFIAAFVYLGAVKLYFSDLKTDIRKLDKAIMDLPRQLETVKLMKPGAPETAKAAADDLISTLKVVVDETTNLEAEFGLDSLAAPREELTTIVDNITHWPIDAFERDNEIEPQITTLTGKIKRVGI